MNYTEKLKLRKPEGGEYYDVEDFNKNSDLLDAAVNSKANKPLSATAGNFPMLDAGGNLGDSGKCAADFAPASLKQDVEEFRQMVSGFQELISEMATNLSDQEARIKQMENALFSDITGNPWSVRFEKLDGLDVTGVYNAASRRIEC